MNLNPKIVIGITSMRSNKLLIVSTILVITDISLLEKLNQSYYEQGNLFVYLTNNQDITKKSVY